MRNCHFYILVYSPKNTCTANKNTMKYGDIVELSIHGIGKHGEGLATLGDFPIFVDKALPGEKIFAKIRVIKSSYGSGEILSVTTPHRDRVTPVCARYADCGGCQLMHLSYQGQLAAKTDLVKTALKDVAVEEQILACVPSPEAFHYRNKIQLPVARDGLQVVTGFYQRGSHNIVPYGECHVHHRTMEGSVREILALLEKSAVKPYDEATKSGTLRHYVVRANQRGEQLVGLVTTGKQKDEVFCLAEQIKAQISNVVGVVENINKKSQNTILGEETIALVGRPFLPEEINGLIFNISLQSFFQVNLATAKIMYETALALADINANTRVLDAYCGIGTLSLLAAKSAKSVLGAECVERAVLDAQENARINGINNAEFVVARLEENTVLFKDVDVAFINPPRQGIDKRVIEALNEFGPQRLIYISCNPTTLARDAQMLDAYQVKKVQPIDMFPQTMHVESVMLLNRKITRNC